MYHYSSPPPGGWAAYDYPSTSAQPHSAYYSSAHHAGTYTPPRTKRHSYRASYSATKDAAAAAGWQHSYQAWQNYYDGVPDYASPPRKHDHVSVGGHKSGTRRGPYYTFEEQQRYDPYMYGRDGVRGAYEAADEDFVHVDVDDDYVGGDDYVPVHRTSRRRSQRRPRVPVDVVYDDFDSPDDDSEPYYCDQPRASHRASDRFFFSIHHRQEPSHRRRKSLPKRPRPSADQYFSYSQVPLADDTDLPKRSSRARRASTSTRAPHRPKASNPLKNAPKATEEDAIRMGIPSGYSIKNWDPTERPILLLGSVFDPNSLGKWIYDWTVFHYGATAPMADVAGDLWLLLIRLAGKLKRAEDLVRVVHSPDTIEMLEDFLESGDRLWARFEKVLKACEHYMWKAAKREGTKGGVTMGRSAGCEFVDSIFGRDRELENTEKLMNSIRIWNMRFDANCEEILKRPDRA